MVIEICSSLSCARRSIVRWELLSHVFMSTLRGGQTLRAKSIPLGYFA